MNYFEKASLGDEVKEIKEGRVFRHGTIAGVGSDSEIPTSLIVNFDGEYKIFNINGIHETQSLQSLFYKDDPDWEYFHAAAEDMFVDEFDREGKYKRTGQIESVGGLIEVRFPNVDETKRWTKSGYKNYHEPQTLFYHEPRIIETINVDLTKDDLINLISGVRTPNEKFHKELSELGLGKLSDVFGFWNWANAGLNKFEVKGLWNIYVKIKPLNK